MVWEIGSISQNSTLKEVKIQRNARRTIIAFWCSKVRILAIKARSVIEPKKVNQIVNIFSMKPNYKRFVWKPMSTSKWNIVRSRRRTKNLWRLLRFRELKISKTRCLYIWRDNKMIKAQHSSNKRVLRVEMLKIITIKGRKTIKTYSNIYNREVNLNKNMTWTQNYY